MFRRARLGDLRRFLRARCGSILPDDDAGREYLGELLIAMSLARDPRSGMVQAVGDMAPWLVDSEAEIDRVLAMPVYDRKVRADVLGDRLNVTLAEREALRITTIRPAGMTDEKLANYRRAKDRARKRQKRKRQDRDDYLANSKSRQRPWEAAGMSRAKWYRRRETGVSAPHGETGVSAPLGARETGLSAANLNSNGHSCLKTPEKSTGDGSSRANPTDRRAAEGPPL